ncbi:MAG: hypothetical protein ACE5QF_03145 [Thermoplasmata archaeon]
MRKRGLLAIVALAALLAFAFLFTGVISANETSTPRMLYDEQGNLIGMEANDAMTRRDLSSDALQAYVEPVEPVHLGQKYLKVFSNEDEPIPMEPPFAPDELVYSSPTADDTPRIAINPTDGRIWVAFTHFNGADDDIYVFYAEANDTTTWTGVAQTTGAFNERNPAIAISGNTIMIAYEQDNVGDEQHTFFIRSQDGGVSWGGFYMNWDWTNDPGFLQCEDFNNPDISSVRPQYFTWTADAWGVRNATRTVTFMWSDNDGDSWMMIYWTATWHMGEDFMRPVIMENPVDPNTRELHNAWQHWNSTTGDWDAEWIINQWTYDSPPVFIDVWGWWSANLDGGNTDLQPDIWVRNDYVYLVWQNGTVDPDLTGFYSDDGGEASLWILFIRSGDGFDQMYPAVYLHDDYLPHIVAVNDTSITYLNNTDVLSQGWSEFKADDFPGWSVADFRATDIIYGLNNPRIVFTDARLGAADIWYTDLNRTPKIPITITHSPPIANGSIVVNGTTNCWTTCTYWWKVGSSHTLEAPTLMADPVNPVDTRYRFASWSNAGPQNQTYVVPSSPETLTANYDPQYNVSFDTAPISGLLIVIDSYQMPAPQSFWWTSGELHNIDVTSPQTIDATSRYVWSNWSDGGLQSHPITVTGAGTYIATFAVQYMVNVTTNPAGLDVEVDNVTYTQPVNSFWWLEGSVHKLNATSPQNVTLDERWSFVDWSDGGAKIHNITVTGPATYTANYITQYRITFTTSPGGLNVEVDTVVYATPKSLWFDVGDVVTINAPSPQPINPQSQYAFLSWNDGGAQTHDITVSNPATYTANFGVEYRIDVNTNPPGLNVTVGGVEHTALYSFWCAQGTPAQIGAPSPQPQSSTMRYRWVNWDTGGSNPKNIFCSAPATHTANFVTQYLLNFSTNPQGLQIEVEGVVHDPAPYLDWFDVGYQVSMNAPSPQGTANTQAVWIFWSDGGAQAHLTAPVTGPATYTAYFDTQYLVTISSTPVTNLAIDVDGGQQWTDYSFWCNAGSLHTLNANSPQMPGGAPITDTRYVWSNWSDGAGQSHSITCDSPNTYTANYVLEYRLTISTIPPTLLIEVDGTVRNTPYQPWWVDGSTHNLNATSPQDLVVGSSRYEFSSWSDLGAQQHDIDVSGPSIYTATFVLKYKVTITSDPVGREIWADGTPYTTPQEFWWESGSPHTLDVTEPQPGIPGEQWIFDTWNDDPSKSRSIIVTASTTYTAYMIHQFEVTLDSTPVAVTVTVDGMQYLTPYAFWCDEGANPTISAVDVYSGGPGVQYAFASWSDGGARTHNIICDMPKTLTADYTTQYEVTITTSPAGLEIIVDLNALTAPQSFWWDSGSTHDVDAASPQAGTTGEQFVFASWSDSGTQAHQVTVTGPDTLTVTFTTQYYLTVDTTHGTASGEGWYDSGETAYAGLDADMYTVGQTRYLFTQWSGDASGTDYAQSGPVLMDAPKTATALFAAEHYLTVTSAYGDPQGEGWYAEGTPATFSVTTPYQETGVTDTRYVFQAWSGDSTEQTPTASISMNEPKTVTATWTTEYLLTVTSAYGDPQGEGWHAEGATATFSVTSPYLQAGVTDTRYVFQAWSGDSTSTSASASVTMNEPKTVTATWITQYYLTVTSDKGSPQGEGWYNEGETATFSVTTPTTAEGKEWEFTGWSGDSTSTKASDTIVMNEPKTVTAKWQETGFLQKFWWIFPVIIVIIIIVILALMMMKRKKPEEEELPPPEEMEILPEEEE